MGTVAGQANSRKKSTSCDAYKSPCWRRTWHTIPDHTIPYRMYVCHKVANDRLVHKSGLRASTKLKFKPRKPIKTKLRATKANSEGEGRLTKSGTRWIEGMEDGMRGDWATGGNTNCSDDSSKARRKPNLARNLHRNPQMHFTPTLHTNARLQSQRKDNIMHVVE